MCGRVYAYQQGTTDAFNGGFGHLEDGYVEGISLTHRAVGSRQHIWSFAAAYGERVPANFDRFICPCINTNVNWANWRIPPFVGNNYFCATANPGPGFGFVYTNDPLWDGVGCDLPTNTCCQLNNPPWFCTTLPGQTTDDLELRMCFNEDHISESVHVSLVEIYTM